jgi:hypothetical protein
MIDAFETYHALAGRGGRSGRRSARRPAGVRHHDSDEDVSPDVKPYVKEDGGAGSSTGGRRDGGRGLRGGR